MKQQGVLTVFVGPMFSGKTSTMLQRLSVRAEHGGETYIMFKPMTDTRGGSNVVVGRNGLDIPAHPIPVKNPEKALEILLREEHAAGQRFHIIAFDEIQFYPGGRIVKFFNLVKGLLSEGYDVFAAGLDLDFRGEPFGATPQIVTLARDRSEWLTAYCKKCGKPARYSQRLINQQPAPYRNPRILVGDKNEYEPRCPEHFIQPGRPVL